MREANLKENNLLKQEAVRQTFFRYAIPSVITMLFFGFQNVVDGLVVGNHVGFEGLGGLNIVLPLYSIIMVIALTVGIGSQTLVSRGIGKGDIAASQTAMTTGFFALAGIGLLSTLLLYFFREEVVTMLGGKGDLFPHAMGYYTGLILFMIPISLCLYSDLMLKGLGHPLFSMLTMSLAVLLNIALDLFFVIWLNMGTMGASIATGLAFCFGLLLSSRITFSPKRKISMLKGRFSWPVFRRSVYNGSSEGVSELSSAIGILIINIAMVNTVGVEGVAAFTAVNYVNFMGVLIFLGISDGLIPVLSYSYGASDFNRVRAIFRFAARSNLVIGIFVFTILQLWGSDVTGLFFEEDTDSNVLDLSSRGMQIFSFVFLANGLNILITSLFTSLGKAFNSIIIAVLRGMVFVAIGVVFLPHYFGVSGIWLSIPIAEILTLCFALILLNIALKKLN